MIENSLFKVREIMKVRGEREREGEGGGQREQEVEG